MQPFAPKVAVIMPAYNASEYIELSVRSILSQSFRDLELIVINDGSKDNTAEILGRIAAEDARLRPVTVENGGPAMARNRGLDLVQPGTEYIMFADSDDELSAGALEYAVSKAGDAELVLLGFTIRNADGSEAHYFEPEQRLYPDTMASALGRLYKANLLNQVWAKLFKASLILDNNIRFPDYRWGEDRLFIYDCLEKTDCVAVLPECIYSYIMHPGESLITKYYDKKFEVCLESDKRMQGLCTRFGVTEEGDFRYMFAKSIFSCITTLFAKNCSLSEKEKRRDIAKIISHPQVKDRCCDAFGGVAVKGLCKVMQTGNVSLNYAAFKFVAWTGNALPALFTKLKHKK